MKHIFLTLVAINAVALTASLASGTISWLGDGLHHPEGSAYLVHFVLGLFSTVGVLLIHCLIMTYFLGTGRWVKEVCVAYDLPDSGWPRQTRDIKRGNTPYAILAMLVTIGTAAAGEGRQHEVWPAWVHAALVVLTVVINAGVWWIEYRNLGTNTRILDEVWAETERIRAAHGLPSSSSSVVRSP